MKAIEQLISDLDNLQQGECWIGYNAVQVLDGIDEKQATARAFSKGNSIWQLVNHISHWRRIVVKRIEMRAPVESEIEGFEEPAARTAGAWQETTRQFQESYLELRKAILELPENVLHQPLSNGGSLYFHIQGAMLHDAFHMGQIMLIRRMTEQVA